MAERWEGGKLERREGGVRWEVRRVRTPWGEGVGERDIGGEGAKAEGEGQGKAGKGGKGAKGKDGKGLEKKDGEKLEGKELWEWYGAVEFERRKADLKKGWNVKSVERRVNILEAMGDIVTNEVRGIRREVRALARRKGLGRLGEEEGGKLEAAA